MLDTENTRTAIVDVLQASSRGSTPSELRTRLHARGIKLQEYEILRILGELRSEGLVSVQRRRWSSTSASTRPPISAKTDIPTFDTNNLRGNGASPPRIDRGWTPSTSWAIDGTVEQIDRLDVTNTGPWSMFRRLLDYYTECLRKDEGVEASANLPQLGQTFVPIQDSGTWYPQPGKTWRYTLPANERLQGLVTTLASSGDAGTLVLGYPIWIHTDPKDKTNDSFLKPIFTYQLDFTFIPNGIRLTTDEFVPDINYDWLRYALKPDQQRSFLTVAGLFHRGGAEETASDGSAAVLNNDFATLSNAITTFFGDKVREPLAPQRLSRLTSDAQPITGIYNHAVIMSAKRTRYTQSLLKDLARIKRSTPPLRSLRDSHTQR